MRFSLRFGVTVVFSCFLASSVSAAPPAGEDAQAVAVEKEQASEFDAVIERIRLVRESGEWQQPAWTDAKLDKSIEQLVDGARRAAALQELRAGTPLAGLRRVEQAGPGRVRGVILAGALAEVAHANGSVLGSPGAVRVSHANGVTFVNSKDIDASHENGCRRVEAELLALMPPRPVNPLDGKLKITQIVSGDDPKRAMAVIEHGGIELAVRPGAEVRGADGKPLDGLAGWTLSFVSDNYAQFARGPELAGFVLKRRE